MLTITRPPWHHRHPSWFWGYRNLVFEGDLYRRCSCPGCNVVWLVRGYNYPGADRWWLLANKLGQKGYYLMHPSQGVYHE